MPSFEMDLLSEIDFAKKYFDFIEITLKLDLSEYNTRYVSKLKSVLKNLEVLGHIHWEIDLSKKDSKEIKKVYKSIKILKKLGARKITIHPSINLVYLSEIIEFCMKNKIQLLVENSTKNPFNLASNIKKIVTNLPSLAITLDTGHAWRTSKFELNKFLKLKDKVKHIHLHDSVNNFDHLFFGNKTKLKRFIQKIKNTDYNKTITLEMFSVFKNKKSISVDGEERRNLLMKQLKIIKNL